MPSAIRRPAPVQPAVSARKQRKLDARSRLQAEARSRRMRRTAIGAVAALLIVMVAVLIIHAATAPPPDNALTLPLAQASGPAVAWSPDGQLLAAAASTGGAIDIWDAGKATLLHTIARPGERVGALAWSGDGRYLAAAVSPIAAQQLAATPIAGSHRLAGRAGRATAPATYLFHLWDATSWTEHIAALRTLAGPVAVALTFSPDGRRVAAQNSQGVILVDVPDFGQVSKKANAFRQQNGYPALSWSPDGRRIAISEEDASVGLGNDRVAILGATTLRTERVLSIQQTFPANLIGAVAWSPDSAKLAIGGLGGQLGIFDVGTGKSVRAFDRSLSAINALGWSRDGIRLAAGGNNELAIFDTRSGAMIQRRDAPGGFTGGAAAPNSVQGLAWSPDGQRLLIGSSNARTQIWRPGAAKV